MWRSRPPRWARQQEKIRRSKKRPIPRFTGWRNRARLPPNWKPKALQELDSFGERAARLRELAEFLVARRS